MWPSPIQQTLLSAPLEGALSLTGRKQHTTCSPSPASSSCRWLLWLSATPGSSSRSPNGWQKRTVSCPLWSDLGWSEHAADVWIRKWYQLSGFCEGPILLKVRFASLSFWLLSKSRFNRTTGWQWYAQSTETFLKPVFRNHANTWAVWTSVSLWCHNYTLCHPWKYCHVHIFWEKTLKTIMNLKMSIIWDL